MDSLPEDAGAGPARRAGAVPPGVPCLPDRARDEVFELADAVLCAGGPVRNLAALSLAPEHRRGHGALYDAVNSGRIDITRLRRCLAGLPLPRAADGRLMLAVDVRTGCGPARPPARTGCSACLWPGKGQAQMIPGWPYSVVAALEPGRTSWTAVLDAVRLGPGDDGAEVTAAQVREVITRLIVAGHWREGDLPILVIFDAGYDPMRLAYQLADLPVEVLGRLRSDRVLHFPVPARQPGTNGRPPQHGREFALPDPATWPDPAVVTTTQTTRYGTAVAQAWDRLHPRLTHRSAWLDHDGPLPVIEGTLIRLQVDHLPGDRDPKPVWLWCSVTGAAPAEVDRLWQAFLRRFDLEHTFRLFKQVLGWTAPKLRDPAAADRWTWIVIACHAQLRLARPLAADLRLPWERPAPPGRLTPARVRRGFRNIHAALPCPVLPGSGPVISATSTRRISASGQRAMAVNAALAALHLGQPQFGPAHQSGEDGLRQAPPSPSPRDPLPGRLTSKQRHRVTVLSGNAATTSLQGGNRRS